MPQYKKVFDIGTYTGVNVYNRVGMPTLHVPGPSGKQVSNSLRFSYNRATVLNRTPSVTGSQQKITISAWVKRGMYNLYAGSSGLYSYINYNLYGNSGRYSIFGFDNNDKLYAQSGLYSTGASTTTSFQLNSTEAFRDPNVWYHCVLAVDTTQATAANRVILYVNGQQITSFSTATYPSQNDQTYWNVTTTPNNIGGTGGGYYFDGVMSEVYWIDGQQLTASSFGEYNSDGIWVPKAYSGTYGTNGFYMNFSNTANTTSIGYDTSGNSNHMTSTNFNIFSPANTTTYLHDSFIDSPTDYGTDTGAGGEVRGTYPTLMYNPYSYATTYDGGLRSTGTYSAVNADVLYANIFMNTGKWFWEVLVSAVGAESSIGISKYTETNNYNTNYVVGQLSTGYGYYSNGSKFNSGSGAAYGASYTSGDIVGIAFDADNGTLSFYKNGTSQGTAFTGLTPGTGPYKPAFENRVAGGTSDLHINFGQRPFRYAAPSGYKAVCSTNFTRPSDSSLWFYGDTPDLMWIKNRTNAASHAVVDKVRSPQGGISLNTNAASVEYGVSDVSELNKFGMSLAYGDGGIRTTQASANFVYWAWKAGSNTSSTSVTNTDGSVTGQVSANRQAGFSIVTFNSGTSADRTVGHGLGAAPNFIIMKSRTSSSYNWSIYHSSVASTVKKYLTFTTDALSDNGLNIWGSAFPTSSVFGFTSGNGVVASTDCIAYCWTSIPGYSSFGQYTGNGTATADGPFVYLGFRPRWIMIKDITGLHDWAIIDTTRDTYNVSYKRLWADLNYVEDTSNDTTVLDILSNGFKLKSGNAHTNNSGNGYIYAAFAEIPFKYARSR